MPKIAMAQMEVIPGRPDLNTKKILQMMDAAQEKKADLVIFPEMSVPGYLLGDTWEQSSFLSDCEGYGQDIIDATKGKELTVIFGNIAVDWEKKNNDGRVRKYNALFIAQDGQLVQPGSMPYPFIIKTLMPNYREFDDTRLQPSEIGQRTRHNARQIAFPRQPEDSGKRLSSWLPAMRRWVER